MEQNNSSWGTVVEKQKKQSEPSASSSTTWGAVSNSYNQGFSTVLKGSIFIGSFIIPLILWLAFGGIIAGTGGGSIGLVIAVIGYPITAFICWLKNSYNAKLFENISRMAQNTEAILYKLTGAPKGGKDE